VSLVLETLHVSCGQLRETVCASSTFKTPLWTVSLS